MKNMHLLTLMRPNLHTLKVAFKSGDDVEKEYTMNIEQGDKVVVETRYGLKIVDVREVHVGVDIDLDARYNYRWIVCKIDLDIYNLLVDVDKDFAATMAQINLLREQEKLVQDLEANLQLPEDSKARQLYEELRTCIKSFARIGSDTPVNAAPGAMSSDEAAVASWWEGHGYRAWSTMTEVMKSLARQEFRQLAGDTRG